MSYAALHVDKTIVDKQSLVTKYLVLLKEVKDEASPSAKRVYLAFKAFEELIDHMGIFKDIMLEIKSELLESVYSKAVTTEENEKKEEVLRRIPYFVLLRRVDKKNNDSHEMLEEQVDILKETLFNKQQEMENLLETIRDHQMETDNWEDVVNGLKETIKQKEKQRAELEQVMQQQARDFTRIEKHLNLDIQDLRDELDEVCRERDSLRPYKEGYDKLQNAFSISENEKVVTKDTKKVSVVATRRAHLISDIMAACRLEEQMLQVQNFAIEEFDRTMELHRELIAPTEFAPTEPETSSMHLFDIERADAKLVAQQARFCDSVDDVKRELEQLRVHIVMLQEQLQLLEQAKDKTTESDGSRKFFSEMTRTKGGVDESVILGDPFIVHERVMSKYAVMMYTSSNGGKSFHEFQEATYCTACGEKTMICPHKLNAEEHVCILPLNSTHLKLARPRVKINQKIVDKALRIRQTSGTFQRRQGVPLKQEITTESVAAPGSPSSVGSEDAVVDSRFKYAFTRIWDDFTRRNKLERRFPRDIDEGCLVSIVEQFWASVLHLDETAKETERNNCMLDKVYDFYRERYMKPDVTILAMHDFIVALLKFAEKSKILQLFCHVLVNNLDGAVFRYLLLLFDLVNSIDWRQGSDFRVFLEVVYTFLNEDDVENLHIGYISHCENKVSKTSVTEYLFYLLLKYREPSLLHFENLLVQQPQRDAGYMTLHEFANSLENLLPVSYDKLTRRLFHEAADAGRRGGERRSAVVSVAKLSHIVSYLNLLQHFAHASQEFKQRITELRQEHDTEHPLDTGENQLPSTRQRKADEELPLRWTMTNVKLLSHNMSRSLEFRQKLIEAAAAAVTGALT